MKNLFCLVLLLSSSSTIAGQPTPAQLPPMMVQPPAGNAGAGNDLALDWIFYTVQYNGEIRAEQHLTRDACEVRLEGELGAKQTQIADLGCFEAGK